MTFSEKLLSTGNLRGNFWLRLILALAGYRRVCEPKLRSDQMNKYFHVFLQNLKIMLRVLSLVMCVIVPKNPDHIS